MKYLASATMLSEVSAYLSSAAAVAADHDPDDGEHVTPGELRRFLAGLRLLQGVPFSYLVPDARLLPLESIRFFYLDRAWTDAVTQGVLSVGTITTADRAQLEAMYPAIRADVDQAERLQRRRTDDEWLDGPGGTVTGFLLRSKLVSGWPALHVRAYRRDVLPDDALSTVAETHPDRMKVLRLERLAPAVLLVLIDGVPEVVHIEEPRQGIQFGVRPGNAAGEVRVQVRDVATGLSKPPKNSLTDANSVPVPFRSRAPGVIDMVKLAERLRQRAPGAGATLDPNEYALQMLRFPYRQVFGDPDEVDGQKFYDLDEFTVTMTASKWSAELKAYLTQADARDQGGGPVDA